MRQHIDRVTIHDCEVQTFRSGGKGGQNQNKRNTGCRVIHHPSGARGEARDGRDLKTNKRAAFVRMGNSPAFQQWARRRAASAPGPPRQPDIDLSPNDLLVEVWRDCRWVAA
jgi:protein subunit release factor B